MDPVTIAMVQFGFQVYSMSKNRGKDPLDAIVGLLSQMDSKLDIIKEKLDIIYKEVLKISEITLYRIQLSDLISVFGQVGVIYKNYNSDINGNLGMIEGRKKFIAQNKPEIENHLFKIRGAFNNLKKLYDPLTVSNIAICARVDYELSILIDKDPQYIKNQMESYLHYFKNALWTSSNNLYNQEDALSTEYFEYYKKQFIFYVKKINNVLHDAYCKLEPLTATTDDFTVEENYMFEKLYQLGYMGDEKFPSIIPQYDVELVVNWPPTPEKIKKFYDYVKDGYINPDGSDYGTTTIPGYSHRLMWPLEDIINYKVKQLKPILRQQQFDRVRYFSAMEAAIESVKFLNQILLGAK